MPQRKTWLRDQRRLTGTMRSEVRRGDRMLYVIVDEGEDLWTDREFGDKAEELICDICGGGRKLGVIIIHTCLSASTRDSIPMKLRRASGTKWILRQGDTGASNLAFGYDADKSGFNAMHLPSMVGYAMSAWQPQPIKARQWLHTDDDVQRHVEDIEKMREFWRPKPAVPALHVIEGNG